MTAMSQNLRLAETIFVTGQSFRYVFTADRKKICHKCCGQERVSFALNKNWLVLSDKVNSTGVSLKCDHCGNVIESRL